MEYRKLGRTGLSVSVLSLGSGGPNRFGQSRYTHRNNILRLVRHALDLGVNFFDTARAYGCSEERLGKAFKGRREDAVIATKSAHLYDENKQLLEIGKVGTGIKELESEGAVNFPKMTELLKPLLIAEKGKSVRLKPEVVIEVSRDIRIQSIAAGKRKDKELLKGKK